MYEHGMFLPVLALVVLTLVIWALMVATRIPAMAKAKLPPSEGEYTRELAQKLPKSTRVISDNYNHLLEQPTIFYATAIVVQLAGLADGINIGLAWAYVALRGVHSIVQTTSNNVPVRFYLFLFSTLALGALAVRALLGMFAAG